MLPLILAGLAATLGCAPLAPPPEEVFIEPGEAAPEAPPPRDRSPLPCSTEDAAATALPWAEAPSGALHLDVTILEETAAAPCLRYRRLLDPPPRRSPLAGSLRRVDSRLVFAPHFTVDAAPVALGPWAIVGGDSGLWLYDLATMTRRARLHDDPVVALATSSDGRRIAFLSRGGARPNGEAETNATLTIASFPELRRLHRFEDMPIGRLRFGAEGRRLTIAAGARGVVFIDPEAEESVRRLETAGAAADALPYPGEDEQLIYVGEANRVVRWDLGAAAEVDHSSAGGASLFGSRDLNALALDTERMRILVGGDDDRVRVYQGLFTDHPLKAAEVHVEGNVADLGCCREGRFVVATERAQLSWVDAEGEVLWELPPLLPAIVGEEMRARPISGEDVLGTIAGRLFLWQPRRPLVVPEDHGVRATLVDPGRDDCLVVTTPASRVVVHRATGEPGPDVRTEVLGELDWFDVRAVASAPDGARALLGTTQRGSGVALIPPGGPLTPVGEVDARGEGLSLRWDGGRREFVVVGSEGEALAIETAP